MDLVLDGLNWVHYLVYLDDVIIFGATFEETMQRLRLVMQRLKNADLKIKGSKCHWFKKSIKYLGHIASEEGMRTQTLPK